MDEMADTIVYEDIFEETLCADLESAIYLCKKHLETRIYIYE